MATATETRSGIDTVEISTPDGKSTGPIPYSEFEHLADAAIGRLRDENTQLSFDLGAGRGGRPDFATVKIAGALTVERDLRYCEHVTITVADMHGEVLCEQQATVGYPAFKDHWDKDGNKSVERLHTATIH